MLLNQSVEELMGEFILFSLALQHKYYYGIQHFVVVVLRWLKLLCDNLNKTG